jgi:hypothetical protein
MHKCLTTSKTQIVLKELCERVAGKHFFTDITTKKNWMQDIGGQLYSRIPMNFVEVVTVIRKLEDLKQKIWPSW